MFEEYNICPYTGLRSFTEEESIYFKGRDEHIEQATKQLEEKKFLMLTGASGDGKSSLVFAGIIPNARAGFLKSKYTDWSVVHFRPERSPMTNLSKTVAEALEISNPDTVESELQHGFSALVDLYKSSKRYKDEESMEWIQADEQTRAEINRSTSNLIILVDQFEEFFTNPENYIRGVPSAESALTLNLMLETAKISYQEDLPIYVIFTMRSDYIGQCSAFRGLPEYIGFSQFFVPRLNRKQLQEVVEESALLSGNQISRRLSERLIHDVIEGTDQLPILQHALNQIWKAADNGNQELDLIHYAKVGGLDPSELPDDDKVEFDQWFKALPQNIQACYHSPGLTNVLDTHANILFESASEYALEKHGQEVSPEMAHLIIKTAFSCLTKIDHSRAVRNRMSLSEIVEIVNRAEINTKKVNAVLDVFREPGNTFIHPFIPEEGESKPLDPDTVLDITHESLIRNWDMLGNWAQEEFDKFTVFADFKQQVDRWLEHDRSWGFLLPIGSLAFFSNWYDDNRPNKYWVNRYNEHVTETAKDIDESAEIVRNSDDFLKLSARKHVLARAIMRFGAKRIGLVLLILVALVFTSFTLYSNYSKTNSFVLSQVKDDGFEILNNGKARNFTAGYHLVLRERLEPGSSFDLIREMEDKLLQLEVLNSYLVQLNIFDRNGKRELVEKLSLLAGELLDDVVGNEEAMENNGLELLPHLVQLSEQFNWSYHFYQSDLIAQIRSKNTEMMAELSLGLLKNPEADMNIKVLNEAMEACLNHHAYSENQIREIIDLLSPFDESNHPIDRFYSRDRSLPIGAVQDRLSYNGLYLELSFLYASLGETENVKRSLDSLLVSHPTLDRLITDGYSTGGYFVSYGYWDELREYATWYAGRQRIEDHQVYQRMLNRSGIMAQNVARTFGGVNFATNDNGWVNPILEQLSDSTVQKLYEITRSVITSSRISPDESHFALAQYYKQLGTYHAKRAEDRKQQVDQAKVFDLFDRGKEHYQQISDSYLNNDVQTFFRLEETVPLKNIWLYPDYRELSWHWEPRTRYNRYHSSYFVKYLIERDLIDELYKNRDDLSLILDWVREYKSGITYLFLASYFINEPDLSTLGALYDKVKSHSESESLNMNLFLGILAERSFHEGDTENGVKYARLIDPQGIEELINEEWFWNNAKTYNFFNQLYSYLVLHEEEELAFQLKSGFSDIKNHIRMFDRTAIMAFFNGNKELGTAFLDSAINKIPEVESQGGDFVNYKKDHAYAIALANGENAIKNAQDEVSNLSSFMRFEFTFRLIVRAKSRNDEYYNAYNAKPALASSEERLVTINQLIYGLLEKQPQAEWVEFDEHNNDLLLFPGFNF